MNADTIIFVIEICLLVLFGGFGLRFVFYDEDGPNLDRLYNRYFNGKVRKEHAEFTRTIGFIFLFIAVVYSGFLIWNDFKPVFTLLAGD